MRLLCTPIRYGAILYDPARISHPLDEDFDANRLIEAGRLLAVGHGRGNVWFVSAREGVGSWVLRHYRRGGLIARFVRDRYLWCGGEATRAFRELRLLSTLEQLDLPAARPVAARYERSWLGYRADLLTLAIPDTQPLAELLDKPRAANFWRGIGRTLRRFHSAGIYHADLNAHNVLIDSQGAVYLVDFDRGAQRAPGAWCKANISRLHRSINKLRAKHGAEVSSADWSALLAGYAEPLGAPPR